ncbi:MAG: SatD family protein [bacterium]|nr:SatD family protein [bacterium]
MEYAVITDDIVRSSKLSNRAAVQSEIKSILHKINKRFANDIIVEFSFSGGDEFQGLVKLDSKVFTIIKEFQKQLYPVKTYFGVGFGKVTTDIAKTTVEMDGNCFHLSRDALEQAKKSSQEIVFFTGNKESDVVLNTVFLLISAIKSSWKDIHYRRIWEYEELGTLERVAKKEERSAREISKTLQDAKYNAIKRAEEFVHNYLSNSTLLG